MSVFVVHPLPDKDLSAALTYGDLIYVNTRYVYGDELAEGDRLPAAVIDRILRAVARFNPDNDYLLIAGDHLQLVAMSAYLSAAWAHFHVLRFDRQAGGYIPVLIEAHDEATVG